MSEGLAVQFLEAPEEIVLPDSGEFRRTCDNWRNYDSGMYYPKDDSGVLYSLITQISVASYQLTVCDMHFECLRIIASFQMHVIFDTRLPIGAA